MAAAAALAPVRIVMVTGFEQFNVQLYRQAAARVKAVAPHVSLQVSHHVVIWQGAQCRLHGARPRGEVSRTPLHAGGKS